MKEQSKIIDGNLISYLDNQKENLPTLLFLHGWDTGKTSLQDVFSSFIDQYRVIAPDFPGCGKSSLPEKGFTLTEYTRQIFHLISELQIKRVHIIGHSFGGRVGIDFASKYPGYIASLTLINSAGIKNTSIRVVCLKYMAKIGKSLGLKSFKQWFYRYIVKETDTLRAERSEALRISFRNVLEEDLQNRAKHIHSPVLLLWGELDESTPLWQGKRWNELIPHSELHVYSGDHFFFLKAPEWTSRKIEAFLNAQKEKSL